MWKRDIRLRLKFTNINWVNNQIGSGTNIRRGHPNGGATNDERENQIAEAIDINGGDNQIEARKNAQINILMKNHENAIKRL